MLVRLRQPAYGPDSIHHAGDVLDIDDAGALELLRLGEAELPDQAPELPAPAPAPVPTPSLVPQPQPQRAKVAPRAPAK